MNVACEKRRTSPTRRKLARPCARWSVRCLAAVLMAAVCRSPRYLDRSAAACELPRTFGVVTPVGVDDDGHVASPRLWAFRVLSPYVGGSRFLGVPSDETGAHRANAGPVGRCQEAGRIQDGENPARRSETAEMADVPRGRKAFAPAQRSRRTTALGPGSCAFSPTGQRECRTASRTYTTTPGLQSVASATVAPAVEKGTPRPVVRRGWRTRARRQQRRRPFRVLRRPPMRDAFRCPARQVGVQLSARWPLRVSTAARKPLPPGVSFGWRGILAPRPPPSSGP